MDEKLWPITMTRKISDIHSGGFSMDDEKRFGFKKGELFELPKELFELITFHKKNLGENLNKYKEKCILNNPDYNEIQKSVFIHKSAQIDGHVEFNTKKGIIVIEKDVHIEPFSYLVGPLRIDEGATIHPYAYITNSYIGKVSKIGGEVDNTTFESYSNKGHHGYIGDAYIGSWVNIGAGSSASNLKNTYNSVSLKGVMTGETFIGPIIADHVKIAINSSIYTGKVIGISSHIYGTVTEDVPAFTNYISKNNKVTLPLHLALKIAETMESRRNIEMTEEEKGMLTDIYNKTKKEREACEAKEGKLLF